MTLRFNTVSRLIANIRRWLYGLRASAKDEFLCDSCKYDYRSACNRPERPNARRCPDYERNG